MYDKSYDDDPVFYCADCHSLSIGVDEEGACDDWDGSYCLKCGGTDIRECKIFEWLDEEARLHGFVKKARR